MPPSAPDLDAVLAAHLAEPDPALLSPLVLRLARRLPEAVAAFSPVLSDPLDRALLGAAPPPAPSSQPSLDRAILAAVAAMEGGEGIEPAVAADLEERAREAGEGWVLAAQVHAESDPERVMAGRRRLSEQDLPYVFPGELHLVVVDVLAVGAQVMPALHVDWARKLTKLAADALVLDCRALGLWFWPVLRSLPTERLVKPITRLGRARRVPPGGLGMAAAYAFRVGAPWEPLLAGATPIDQLVAALALIGDRPA